MRFTAVHLLIFLAVVVLLFGSTRLPTLARSLGQSMKIFKSEVKDLRDDETPAAPPVAGAPVPGPTTTTAAPAATPTGSTATGATPGGTTPQG
ncbi:Sec-independent protein translocase subunit TatA [Cellulomonas endophytica]|uniref:Sec-independent protein translocase subunit TatA n=1 Tax=Cellulomonas endophytica TaxID=2494735 RepID=UPI0010101D7A|nr:Sec-independent protein translocase subunit TatA [Cellulomonas endophytica]